MAKISFKAKIQTVYNMDDTVAYHCIKVPELTRSHCDMDAFRRHPKYRSYANSDLFPGMLRRIRKDKFGETIRLDKLPDGVTVDTSGFLAVVSISV